MKANKKKAEEDVLPGVERSCFEFDDDAMYWIDVEGVKHKIITGGILANGVRDLCIYWKGPRAGDVAIGKKVDVSKERILWIPQGDILWLKFEAPVYGDRHSVYVDIESDPRIKPMVRETLRKFGGAKGTDYEMFGGEQYL